MTGHEEHCMELSVKRALQVCHKFQNSKITRDSHAVLLMVREQLGTADEHSC
jgi:hypothetical protein